jgi:hypothetical protein
MNNEEYNSVVILCYYFRREFYIYFRIVVFNWLGLDLYNLMYIIL